MTNDGAKRAIVQAFYSEFYALNYNRRDPKVNDAKKRANLALQIIS
jgi:hypothetical protein